MANRIHITSSGPRTGTTLLTEVIKNCFQIDCSCDHEASLMMSNTSFGQCNEILTKKPSRTRGLKKILRFEKKLYVICLIRDPRDMIVSYHGKIYDQYYCGLNFWMGFLDDYEDLKDHKRFIFIRYEDFTSNPDKIQKLIEEKIPSLKRKHKFSEFHLYAKPDFHSEKALKNLRPIETRGVGNWRNHLERVKQQINKYGDITESLKKFGYETDLSWIDDLKSVEDKEFVSYKPEERIKERYIDTYGAMFNFALEKININPDKVNWIFSPILYLKKRKNI